jgi:hypothetical protein
MIHRHLLVRAVGLTNAPRKPADVVRWLVRLADAVNMKIMMGPWAQRCDVAGNAGVTGAVAGEPPSSGLTRGMMVIETSHATVHCWDEGEVPFLQMDLYSCAEFSTKTVTEMLREFGPTGIEWMLIDRNGAPEMIEAGSYTL